MLLFKKRQSCNQRDSNPISDQCFGTKHPEGIKDFQ